MYVCISFVEGPTKRRVLGFQGSNMYNHDGGPEESP